MPNRLAKELSPYLLQHANNPVDWYPWSNEAFEKAKNENKLLLISIGYSACHWCHVMERECFEDEQVAGLMNRYFVNIKVDREERPDIDQIYMNALQLMSGQGGWPLNCFAIPDGRPVYGGTYYPKEQWIEVLYNLFAIWKDEPEKVISYANKLTRGIQLSEKIIASDKSFEFNLTVLTDAVNKIKKNFDKLEGGINRAPKFPMPNNWNFYLHYAHVFNDSDLLNHVYLTLDKMAMGGIYDQIGGGFARYATDMLWKIPHFEKMLYDNAQLISLYSKAYKKSKKILYKETVLQTIEFIKRELTGKNNEFYSALDADSEGEEGKYYTWTEDELKSLLNEEDFLLLKNYYNLNQIGLWEQGKYILLRRTSDEAFAKQYNLKMQEFYKRIEKIKNTLLNARNKRVKPGLDNKTLTSWNALTITALCDAYSAFGHKDFLNMAESNMHFILSNQLKSDNGLWHIYKSGISSVNGFLEDYAFVIEALINLYQCTYNENYLDWAEKFTAYTDKHFFDNESKLYFFTSDLDIPLIARKTEIHDNVIPSSNSGLAKSLFLLDKLTGHSKYQIKALNMLRSVYPQIPEYLPAYTNWAELLLWHTGKFYEVAVCGEQAYELAHQLRAQYLPDIVIAASHTHSTLPLLNNRLINQKTRLYICQNNTCNLPVESLDEALQQLL
jgi:uncharacterized protein YyaL (SSP411 family)